jgi:hypothetical protein
VYCCKVLAANRLSFGLTKINWLPRPPEQQPHADAAIAGFARTTTTRRSGCHTCSRNEAVRVTGLVALGVVRVSRIATVEAAIFLIVKTEAAAGNLKTVG